MGDLVERLKRMEKGLVVERPLSTLREAYETLESLTALSEKCRSPFFDRLLAAEAVCEKAGDMLLEHYEWCDRRVALAARREVPPPECDCGVLAFKVALNQWRASRG